MCCWRERVEKRRSERESEGRSMLAAGERERKSSRLRLLKREGSVEHVGCSRERDEVRGRAAGGVALRGTGQGAGVGASSSGHYFACQA